MTEGAWRARAKYAPRRDTHSLMTGAVRFAEQLWLLTDCGRWAGLSKATTVTFNLPNPHAHKYSHHHWHYNIFSAPHPACLIAILHVCWGPGLPQGGTRVEPVTKPIYLSLETLFLSLPECVHTQRAATVPSHPAQAQAGSCRACFNDFLSPSPCCI